MPVSPEQFAALIAQVESLQALASYQAANQLEILKPEMTDTQRDAYESALGNASRHRQEIAKANEEACKDDWDQDEN